MEKGKQIRKSFPVKGYMAKCGDLQQAVEMARLEAVAMRNSKVRSGITRIPTGVKGITWIPKKKWWQVLVRKTVGYKEGKQIRKFCEYATVEPKDLTELEIEKARMIATGKKADFRKCSREMDNFTLQDLQNSQRKPSTDRQVRWSCGQQVSEPASLASAANKTC